MSGWPPGSEGQVRGGSSWSGSFGSTRYLLTYLPSYWQTKHIEYLVVVVSGFTLFIVHYGITSYGVSRPGIQNKKDFCIKINISKKIIEF